MNKSYYQLFFAITFLFVGCNTSKSTLKTETSSNKNKIENVALTQDKKSEFEYLFIEGLKQKMMGNQESATQYFNSCLEIDPNSAASLFELANIYAAKGEIVSAKLLLEKAIQINSENKWYQILLAKIYENNSQFSEASKIYSDLIKNDPENIDYYYVNALLLSSAKEYTEAIKVYNQLEEKVGFNEQISLSRQQLYRNAGKKKEAYSEIERLIKKDPSVPEYYGVMADMYKEDGNTKKALEYYNKVLEINPNNGFVHFSLATFHIQNKDLEKAYFHAKSGFMNPDVEIETKIQLYLMLSNAPEDIRISDEKINELIQSIVETHPDDSRSYSIQADYYFQKNQLKEARDYMIKALDINPNTYPLWEQLIITESQMEEFESMTLNSNKAIELFPTQPLPYVLNAISHIQQKDYKKALEILEKGKIYVTNNKRLQAQFELYSAEAYYNLEKSEEAFSAFEKVIEIEPENFMAMNNYAYYLSIRGEELEKAELLSGRVVQANPDNATYLDTHAWVLFKKKEYRLAKFYMETAMKNGGDENDVVVEHYGDILYMLDDIDGALKNWNLSVEMGNKSKTLKQKISEKRFIEGDE